MNKQASESSLFAIRPLQRAFFARSPRRVARELLGKVLVRDCGKIRLRPASSKSRPTSERTIPPPTPPPATHRAIQSSSASPAMPTFISSTVITTASTSRASAKAKPGRFLFRALEPLLGMEQMARSRGIPVPDPRHLYRLTSGPGRLAQAFGITRTRDNGRDLTSPASGLWIGADSFRATNIQSTPRIGSPKPPPSLSDLSLPEIPAFRAQRYPMPNVRARFDK